MKRAFEKVKADNRIFIGYGVSLFLLLVVYVITLVANTRLKERADLVEGTYKIMFSLESFISKIKDAETGVRGYYITRDIEFLQPYINSKRAADSIFTELKSHTMDNRLQQQRLDELKVAYTLRFDQYKEFLEFANKGPGDSAYNILPAQEKSKKSMDKIRSLISFMQMEEKRQLNNHDLELNSTFKTINTITIISLLLTLILVIIGFVAYFNENKARKEGLQKIQGYQDELFNRIEQLNIANAQLKQMRSIEKFAATGRIARTIAHEVRNPLTNIDLATSQLKAEVSSLDDSNKYFFDVIQRNSTRINKLISDLLESTKFAELNLSKVFLTKLLDETLTIAKDRIELQQVTVKKRYNCIEEVHVDTEKLKIAFLNIIINAVEAMQVGKGVLNIETKTEGNNCYITITDNGYGMDETTMSKLFEPYFTNKPQGNGLGLANAQNIIFNHKGTISVSSCLDKGSSFTITIPVGES